jgi:putative sporulation protein YtaF
MANEKPKRKFTFPSAFTILFLLLIVIAAATWFVPAGSYDYDENGSPLPGTYHQVPSNPQALLKSALKGPITGMYGIQDETGNVDVWNYGELFGAIDVAMFVLIIGGFLGVTMKTGAINSGIAWVVSKLKGKEKWMFPILMVIFAIGGTSYGMAEETLAFYALIITVMLAAGYDALSAAALIMLGAGIGCLGSTVNPFATGIALGAGGVFSQVLSTWGTRILGAVLLSMIGIMMIGKTLIEEMTTNTAYSVRIKSLNLVISVLKEPTRADTDRSGDIDVGESVVLGIALALNCIASGIAAGLMHFPFILTTFAVACLSYLTVLAGWYLGSRAGTCWLGKKAGFLAGLILIIVSFCQLKA